MNKKPYIEKFYVQLDDRKIAVFVRVLDIVDYLFNIGGNFLHKQVI